MEKMTQKKRDLIGIKTNYCFACGTITDDLSAYTNHDYPGAEPYCQQCSGEIETAADQKIKEIKIKSGMWEDDEKES